MVKYYIYHIPGVKVGCSKNPKSRVKGQGYNNFEILETHTDIDIASKREIELQIEYGYGRDCNVTYKQSLESFNRPPRKYLSKEELYDLYVNKKLTIIEIHRLTNIYQPFIKRMLEEFNIPQKSLGKSISLSVRRKKEYSEDDIIKLYKKGYSLRKIGRLTDYGRQTVGKIINEYNIKDPEREFINKIKNDVIKLNSQGYSERKLSRDFNTTRRIIKKVLKENSPV